MWEWGRGGRRYNLPKSDIPCQWQRELTKWSDFQALSEIFDNVDIEWKGVGRWFKTLEQMCEMEDRFRNWKEGKNRRKPVHHRTKDIFEVYGTRLRTLVYP